MFMVKKKISKYTAMFVVSRTAFDHILQLVMSHQKSILKYKG